jgi:hypothetical protein
MEYMTCMFNPIVRSLVITFFYDQVLFCYVCLNAFNVCYILARYKRKVEVQIEMYVKYYYSKGVMT